MHGTLRKVVRLGPLRVLQRIIYRAFCAIHKLDLGEATHDQIGISESDGNPHGATGGVDLAEAYVALGLRNRVVSVLDIGCGKGAALIAFHRLGVRRLYGVELSRSMIEICETNLRKLKVPAELKQMNAIRIDDFTCFDLIYTFNTLPRHTLKSFLDKICGNARETGKDILILFGNLKDEDLIIRPQLSIIAEVQRSMKYILVQVHACQNSASGP